MNTLAEAAPNAPPQGKVRLLAPNNVVYAVDAASANEYEQHGYTRYNGPTIDEGSIEAKFADWRKTAAPAAKAAGLGALNQVPLLDYGLSKVAPETAQELATATAEARKEHGVAYGVGSVAGALGTVAAGGAALKGLGVAGAVASRVPKLAALAEASPVLTAAGGSALSSAALDAADQIDSQALEHAITPAGQEKLTFSYGRVAAAAGLGAVLPGVVGSVASGLGKGGRGVQQWARERLVGDFISPAEQQALRDAGKGHVLDLAKDLTQKGEGSEQVVRAITDKVHSADTNLKELLFHTRDHSMTLDEARSALDAVLQYTGNTNLIHDDIRPLTKAIASHEEVAALQHEVNLAQGKVGAAQATGIGLKNAETQLARKAAALQDAKASVLELPKDKELQEMARKLYDRVRWRNPVGNEHYQGYKEAGEALAEARDVLYARINPKDAALFKQTRNELSDHLALAESVTTRHIPAVMESLNKAEGSAAVAGSMAALGLRGGSIAGSAATGGAMAMMYYGGMRSVAAASRYVASKLVDADARLASAIKLGLYGTAAPRVALHPYEFQNMAARFRAAQRDPVTSFSNMHASLIDDGAPEHVADKVALRLHAVVQASARTLPQRQTSPDLASAAQPDLHQQRAWVGETRSRLDPTYAIQYPTAQNMAAAKEHHPETIARAQEAVMDALHKNPYLPLASRMWAARVLGRPAGGLTNPTFYQSLSQMRAKADAEAQQGQGRVSSAGQRGKGASGVAQSEQTRLGELSTTE